MCLRMNLTWKRKPEILDWMLIFYSVSVASCLIPLFAALYVYQKLTSVLKIFLLLLVLVAVTEASGFILSYEGVRYLWIYHIYTLVEYSLFVLIFLFWQKEPRVRKILGFSIPGFFVIWLIAKFSVERWGEMDNFTSSLEAVILIGVAAYTLINLTQEKMNSLIADPRFWITMGVLIYFTGNIVTFALGNVLLSLLQKGDQVIWPLHSILNIVANLFYAGGFLCLLPR